MARHPGAEAVYRVADLFRERCLVAGTSLLWPDHRAWTAPNIDALWHSYMGEMHTEKGSFLDLWSKQLADRSPDVHRVAADVLTFYYLFPSQIRFKAKMNAVQRVIGWTLAEEIEPGTSSLLDRAFSHGVGSGGTFYATNQPYGVAFYLQFARRVFGRTG